MKDIEGIEGNDVAGYVEAVGEGVRDFKKGDKVAAMTDSLTQDGRWSA
jgi:NADPH:quinone reductase-like Zn-dependent oxidoreductase